MIRIAMAKGRLSESAVAMFQEVGLAESVDLASRRLVFEEDEIAYMFLKPKDVMTYVQNGIADLGIVGSDVIEEAGYHVYELMDLGFGSCKFALAAPEGRIMHKKMRLATKYPNVARKYLGKTYDLTIIPLNGSVELAPLAGLSDGIVDIVETGKTLKANRLIVLEDLCHVSARLICNKVTYRIQNRAVTELMKLLKGAMDDRQ